TQQQQAAAASTGQNRLRRGSTECATPKIQYFLNKISALHTNGRYGKRLGCKVLRRNGNLTAKGYLSGHFHFFMRNILRITTLSAAKVT
ncbi:hypothetical protein, partial [Aeromonas allosaccharophila]|uniref:hypothetical protein n=1 Tax=Aeromonas allosaccharophila TaxID=656 RepID=UPI0036DA1F96